MQLIHQRMKLQNPNIFAWGYFHSIAVKDDPSTCSEGNYCESRCFYSSHLLLEWHWNFFLSYEVHSLYSMLSGQGMCGLSRKIVLCHSPDTRRHSTPATFFSHHPTPSLFPHFMYSAVPTHVLWFLTSPEGSYSDISAGRTPASGYIPACLSLSL